MLRIISRARPGDSCWNLSKKFDILPLPCEYIISLILFVVDNQNNFSSGLDVHGLNAKVEINSICQLQISLFSGGVPCLLALGYLIDCLLLSKISKRIELVLKIIWFHIS
jgi:hypothetical protein